MCDTRQRQATATSQHATLVHKDGSQRDNFHFLLAALEGVGGGLGLLEGGTFGGLGGGGSLPYRIPLPKHVGRAGGGGGATMEICSLPPFLPLVSVSTEYRAARCRMGWHGMCSPMQSHAVQYRIHAVRRSGSGFVSSRRLGGGGLLALRPTHPKKSSTQNLAEGKSSLNKRPLCGTPPDPPLTYSFHTNKAC